MKVIPLGDKIVVKNIENIEKTKSGFILPFSSQEKQQIAKIIAVGEYGIINNKEVKLNIKIGDTVLYSKYSGNDFKLNGENLTIIQYSDILAILEQ